MLNKNVLLEMLEKMISLDCEISKEELEEETLQIITDNDFYTELGMDYVVTITTTDEMKIEMALKDDYIQSIYYEDNNLNYNSGWLLYEGKDLEDLKEYDYLPFGKLLLK